MLDVFDAFAIFTITNLKCMEKKVLDQKTLLEKARKEVDVFKGIINKRTLIEEKFNQVNVKLDQLKAEADKLFGPKK